MTLLCTWAFHSCVPVTFASISLNPDSQHPLSLSDLPAQPGFLSLLLQLCLVPEKKPECPASCSVHHGLRLRSSKSNSCSSYANMKLYFSYLNVISMHPVMKTRNLVVNTYFFSPPSTSRVPSLGQFYFKIVDFLGFFP